ncbi:DUF2252 domain-containing protein, partial [Streptomyces sp. Act-28]
MDGTRAVVPVRRTDGGDGVADAGPAGEGGGAGRIPVVPGFARHPAGTYGPGGSEGPKAYGRA